MSTVMKITDEAYRLELNYASLQSPALSCLCAARRDSAAFQILVQSSQHYSVNITRGEWFSTAGRLQGPHQRLRLAVEAPFPTEVHLEEFITDDDGVQKADILLNQNVRESRANIPSAVWAEVRIPEDATPGQYEITVRLYSAMYGEDEVLLDTQTIPLRVYAYTLPEAKNWDFYLDLWQHTSNIARKHDVILWSDEHFEVLKNYARTLAALGQKSITVCVSEIPWNGQNCFKELAYTGNVFEYSMIPVTKRKDGTFCYDYSIMQRYIDLCRDAGIDTEIEVFGLMNMWGEPYLTTDRQIPGYPEAVRIRYLDENDGCMKYVRDAEVLKDYVRSLEAYFLSTNQIDHVRIVADEPGDVEKYRRSLAVLKEIAPNFRCKCAINHVEFIEQFYDRIDDFVPYIECTVTEYNRLMDYRSKYPDKTFLWYICTGGGHPNSYLRTPPIENRVIGILTDAWHLDGFLRWNYTVWPDEPRKELRYSPYEAGDTNFVYPAYNGGVLLSLRYKNLQRGIADYELLKSLREKQGDAAAEALIGTILRAKDITDFYRNPESRPAESMFSLDWCDYNVLKEELLKLLED